MVAAVLGAGAAPPAPPAPTYRIIGPDGKVTFSDRKPTDPQVRAHELGHTVTAPLLAPSSAPFDLHPATAIPAATRPAGGDAPPLDISGKPFPPGLPEAILDVLVHQFFVQTLWETCDRLRPAFAEHYRGGVRNWRDRNADILAKSNHIAFTRFTGEQRDLLRATGRARLEQLLPPPNATPEDKVLWCDRTSTDLARRQFDLVGDMRVVPILDYQAP
ncbi:MAG: hypothetical protein ACJ8GJ_01275 [Vitreoscilla sp.]